MASVDGLTGGADLAPLKLCEGAVQSLWEGIIYPRLKREFVYKSNIRIRIQHSKLIS